MRRASLLVGLALAAAAALPAQASAHAGLTAPAATSYLARIATVPRGLEARVVDGDQRLWLRVPPQRTVVVLGLRGEPYLRFSARGVEVNERSVTFFLDRPQPWTVPAGIGPRTPPSWQLLTSAHSTSWHDDRLHALALAARPPGARELGRWVVPLVVDGRRTWVDGTLWQAPRPSLLWLWPLVLLLACVPALLRLREAGWHAGAGWSLGALALAASTVGRLGRELYGRPSVSAGQLALVGLTCLVAAALAGLWLLRVWRPLAATLVGVLAVVQGLSLWATLRNAYVLAAVPPWLERACASLSLAAGAALVLVTVSGRLPRRPGEDELEDGGDDEEAPAEALVSR